MTEPRHRQAGSAARLRRLTLVVVPLLVVGTSAAVAMSRPEAEPKPSLAQSLEADLGVESDADVPVSRSQQDPRPPIRATVAPKGAPASVEPTSRFATADLNVWTGPGEQFRLQTVVSSGSSLKATGATHGSWAQIIYQDKVGWVRVDFLAKDDPADAEPPTEGVTLAPCPLGSSVETGLTPDAIRVYRSVCATFPEVSTYGGVRPDGGEHGEGRALDIMVPSGAVGDAISEWVRANSAALGASEVLWAQHIWTVERSGEGWRSFSDRGSATANHYDHVHVTVYGN